ncbi:hypothetical protein [Sinorhizobium meliloti]|uniref:hypothetical protein n=1 Tax=Rhizobium meliloti TaxID=382 RepID=UPI00238067C8|nr:hypothetical protein [Sinorhizobium meliloti]
MFGGTSAQNIRVDAEGAAVGQLRTFTAGTEKIFRRGGFVKPAADVIAAVIGNRRPDEADYWWTWFDIVAGELDDATHGVPIWTPSRASACKSGRTASG